MLCELLVQEFGIDAADIVPEATFDSLELDSLSLAELAVIVADQTDKDFGGLGNLDKDTTLVEAAAAFEAAPRAEPFGRAIPGPATPADAPAAAPAAAPVHASSSDG
ncbi:MULTISPECIES: acyl carrier protein [unclassified Embleya]|uniref:acyl carrier protein n=1 Tax=unclassified Embleya TaxID=2699296 RepID=UPI0033C2B4B8